MSAVVHAAGRAVRLAGPYDDLAVVEGTLTALRRALPPGDAELRADVVEYGPGVKVLELAMRVEVAS